MTHDRWCASVEAGEAIGALARRCLVLELETDPKPGLVGPRDGGSHRDMDAAMLRRSAAALQPFFAGLARAGARGAEMDALRRIGVDAERAMLAATGGVNTHRGAVFGLGLLCAAAGWRNAARESGTLGAIVSGRWGAAIASAAVAADSNGGMAMRRHGVAGARGEAAAGFPAIYATGRPALARGLRLASGDAETARVEALMALVAVTDDTNLLHRGGAEGLAFARAEAAAFLAAGGVGAADWRERAEAMHRAFVARRLSPGGSADLLAMTLFADIVEGHKR